MPEPIHPRNATSAEGVRERKRRETRQRIAETGLRLFLADGYERTTLDAIAAEAGISRRTFFSYFKSKDDILFAWQETAWESMYAELRQTSPDVAPLDAMRDLMVKYGTLYSADDMTSIDRVMRSEAVAPRKQAFYTEQEQALFATLCEVWRQPERRMALRMVAMVSIGAMRIAVQAWNDQQGARKPIGDFLRDAFGSLRSEL